MAFINISADFLIYQFKPSSAITFVAYHEVFADVRTAAIINQAFVYMTFFQGFVTPVPAVLLLVTYLTDIYALPTSALELAGAQALIDVFAVDLVRAVYAVPDAVALPAAVDAAPVLALELVRAAGARRTVDLVTAVFAVGVPVAAPLLVDALAGAALGLAGRALGVHHGLAAALLQRLVGLVGAVGVVVAQPAAGDAGRGAAPELVRAARRGRARLLVAAVAAVVLAVADEIPGDAAAAGAGELVGAARDVATVLFIFATVTIIFTITPPGHGDTLSGPGATADFIYAACSHMALFWVFIRAVFTVGIPVTLPPAGDTLAIVAHKV